MDKQGDHTSLRSEICRGHLYNAFLQGLRGAMLNMCLPTLQGNALLRSQFVLAWVQRIPIFGSSDRRLLDVEVSTPATDSQTCN